jgi:hypothetical protein
MEYRTSGGNTQCLKRKPFLAGSLDRQRRRRGVLSVFLEEYLELPGGSLPDSRCLYADHTVIANSYRLCRLPFLFSWKTRAGNVRDPASSIQPGKIFPSLQRAEPDHNALQSSTAKGCYVHSKDENNWGSPQLHRIRITSVTGPSLLIIVVS